MKHPTLKKLFLVTVSAFFMLSLSAQSDTVASRKNSVSVNVNSLLSQIFNSGYNSQSFLTYRRHFQKWNLRLGIGGFYNYSEVFGADPNYFDNSLARANLRTGYERAVLKYNRWNGYLGIDAVTGYYQFTNTAPFDNGVIRKRSGYTWSFGASPLMGIIFQMNDMIGFGVETSYDVLLETGQTKDEFTYNGVLYSSDLELNSGISTSYGSPLRLNLRICF